jgi:hypothetical protein
MSAFPVRWMLVLVPCARCGSMEPVRWWQGCDLAGELAAAGCVVVASEHRPTWHVSSCPDCQRWAVTAGPDASRDGGAR